MTNIGEIYLPLIMDGTLQEVSEIEDTLITFADTSLTSFPLLAGTSIMVPSD
jgi:hypothetical protein